MASGQFCVRIFIMPTVQPQQIACQQVLEEDNSVFSIQWTDLPAELARGMTPSLLLERYLTAIKRMTGGLIQPRQTAEALHFCCLAGFPCSAFCHLSRSIPDWPYVSAAACWYRRISVTVVSCCFNVNRCLIMLSGSA